MTEFLVLNKTKLSPEYLINVNIGGGGGEILPYNHNILIIKLSKRFFQLFHTHFLNFSLTVQEMILLWQGSIRRVGIHDGYTFIATAFEY